MAKLQAHVAPSILAADFAYLGDAVKKCVWLVAWGAGAGGGLRRTPPSPPAPRPPPGLG